MIADLFAGARGWEAASELAAVGFEHDRDACRTSAAAGLLTVRCDLFDYPIPTVDERGAVAIVEHAGRGNRTEFARDADEEVREVDASRELQLDRDRDRVSR